MPTPGDQPRCDICRRQNFAESILSCERCITAQHTFCLPYPLVGLPDRRWLCPACSESSLRLYPSRRRRRSNSSVGAGGGIGERSGAGAGNDEKPSAGSPLSASKTNGEAKSNGSHTAVVCASGTTAAASSKASSSTSKRARKSSTDNGALPPAEASKEAAKAAAGKSAVARRDRPEQFHRARNSPADTERDESLDPGSTVTLFCRRDFRRYLRWKRRELASQDNERRKEEQTRARKTFSSIVASSR